jgi:hypothetical protein
MKPEYEEIITKVASLLQVAEDRNCTMCVHWEDNPELCKIYKVRPPASVIVKGCKDYDYVPF